MPNGGRCLKQVNSSLSLLDNLAKRPIRRSGCTWHGTLKRPSQEEQEGWHLVDLLRSKADRSFDRAEGEAFWHCFFHRFDNIRKRPLLIRTQGSRFCFNKDCSIIPPSRASAEFFYHQTTRRLIGGGKPRNYTCFQQFLLKVWIRSWLYQQN